MEAAPKRIPNWSMAVACLLPLLGFWTYGLFDLDEGYYAAVVADMVHRGDWLTPTLNGVPWFEKPILAYWLAIPSVEAFGPTFGPRLPSVLCTLATVWVVYRFGKRHLGEPVGRVAALVYATNLLVVGIGRMMMTDAPLVLCLTLALTTFYNSVADDVPTEPRQRVFLRLASAFCVGLAVLAKGPVAAVLLLVAILAFLWRVPEARAKARGGWTVGTLLFVATVAVWYVPCYLENGQVFVQKFLIEQNLGRFSGGDQAHTLPTPLLHPVYFPIVLLVSFSPWAWFALRALFRRRGGQDACGAFLWIAALVPLALFTLSGTKLPHYILPAVAPLALLVARALLEARPRWRWEHVGLAWSACAMVLAQFTMSTYWVRHMRDVQRAALWARGQSAAFVVYRIGREGPSGTGGLQIDDTSHPSIGFYYNYPYRAHYVETDERAKMARLGSPVLFLTRKGRWTPEDTRWIGDEGFDVSLIEDYSGADYELWRVQRRL